MALSDIQRDNSRYTTREEVEAQLEPSVRNLLEQIAKVDPNEVAAIVVAIRNKDEDGPNLVGLVGGVQGLKQCAVEIVVRIEQLSQRPADATKAVDDDD